MRYTGTAQIPRGFLATDGICPVSQEERPFLLPQNKMADLQKRGPEWKFYDAMMIPDVSSYPTVIFEGLMRDDCNDCYCYCGVPKKRIKKGDHGSGTIEVPFPPNRVFLVFVRCNDKGFVVFDFIKEYDQGRKQLAEWRTKNQLKYHES